MSLHKIPELKLAILNLPEQEKDKLLVRLIGKDPVLMNQLHFRLLEDSVDLAERRERLAKLIEVEFSKIKKRIQHRGYHERMLMVDLRTISGYVNEHFLITKDKLGELQFRLNILTRTFQLAARFFQGRGYESTKLFLYITGRIKNIVQPYKKLHEDLQYDYREELNKILTFAYSSALKPYLIDLEISDEL